MWRKQFIQNLIKTNESLNIMYKKYGFYPTIQLPKKLETEKEILSFAHEINDAIRFPEHAYLKKKK